MHPPVQPRVSKSALPLLCKPTDPLFANLTQFTPKII